MNLLNIVIIMRASYTRQAYVIEANDFSLFLKTTMYSQYCAAD